MNMTAQAFLSSLQDFTQQHFWETPSENLTWEGILNQYALYYQQLGTHEERLRLSDFFWKKIKEYGTPLISKQPDGTYNVTFLYQSTESNLQISLESQDLYDRLLDPETGEKRQFEQFPGTDMYYLRMHDIPENAYAQYSIAVGETTISDPYNLTKNDEGQSALKMPNAAVPSIVKQSPDINHFIYQDDGTTEKKIKQGVLAKETFSSSQGQEREILIYKPKGYDESVEQDRRVVFVFDGKELAKSIVPSLEASTNNYALKNTAFVFIDSTHANRANEFYLEHAQFSRMVADELVPHYRNQLNIEDDKHVILAGHSLAVHPILDIASHRDIGGIILASPALNLCEEPSTPPTNVPIYMQIGQLEDIRPPKTDLGPDNKHMRDISRLDACRDFHTKLKNAGCSVSVLDEHPYGHSEVHIVPAIQQGLQYIKTEASGLLKKAEARLKERFGPEISIASYDFLSEPARRNLVLRIHLTGANGEMPKSVLLKQSLPDGAGDTAANERFARDWAGLSFSDTIQPETHHVPRFYCGDKENCFILMEDLGSPHVSVANSLLSSDDKRAVSALERYVTALGQFHAASFNHTEEYRTELAQLNENASTPEQDLSGCRKTWYDNFEALHITMTPELEEEITQVLSSIYLPGPFTVLVHGDIAPDNVFDHGDGKTLQLLDFEWAFPRNALLDGTYLRMCIPTGWCAKATPESVLEPLENRYREELKKTIPAARDDAAYHTAYTQACAFHALQEIAHQINKLMEKDSDWGTGLPNNLGRSRVLSRLQAFIDIAEKNQQLPHLKQLAQQMLEKCKNCWPDAKPLEYYPAFMSYEFQQQESLHHACSIPSSEEVAERSDIAKSSAKDLFKGTEQSPKSRVESSADPDEEARSFRYF